MAKYELVFPLIDKNIEKNNMGIRSINLSYDISSILYNLGTKRICENSHDERNYLKAKFTYWTSEDDDIKKYVKWKH